jgi:TonB-linked SusC/RagA family outer membrane protein
MRKLLQVLLLLCAIVIPGALYAQETVTGKVTDPLGNPLVGATVKIRSSSIGTSTDAGGNFSLRVPNKKVKLVVSYVGYGEMTVDADGNLNVQLTEDNSKLSEVVVTGLASSIKKSNAANAVTRINAKELTGTTRPPTLDNAMQGKIPGAQITANTGAPGGGFTIRLRGASTVAGSSDPLYVIDGVIINNDQFPTGAGTGAFNGATSANAGSQDQAPNRIADLNPADIESLEVLKGPSAAAIYGTRAAGGVIVITTKRGKSGRTKISVNQDLGIAKARHLLGSSNWSPEKIAAYGGIYGLPNVAQATALYNAAGGKTWDYEKIIWGNTGFISNTNLTVSGGTERTRFYASGSYQHETGIQKRTGFDRRSLRINLDHKLNDWIDIKLNSNYLNTYASRSYTGNDNNGVSLSYSLGYIPNFLDLNRRADGTYPESIPTGQNPLEIVDRGENVERTNRFLYSGEINMALLRRERYSLKLNFRGGVDYLVSEPRNYMPEDVQYQSRRANPGASRYSVNKAFNTYMQTGLTFNVNVGNNLELTTGLIALRDGAKRDVSWIQGTGLLPGQRNPSTAAVRLTESLVFAPETVVALDAGQEFNWDDKVVGRVGVRADKSTLSGLNYDKYYYFPRASVAVNLTNFNFLQGNSVLSLLKPRVAYGETSGFPTNDATYSQLAGVVYSGLLGSTSPTTLGLAALDPERLSELEFGLDVGLLNNRVVLEATYYNKKTEDFLFAYTLAPSSGVTSYKLAPVGDMTNKGVEISLTGNVVKKSNIDWSTTFLYWSNKSKITRLIVPPAFVASSGFGAYGRKRIQQGYSPTAWWGFDSTGALIPYKDAQPKFQLSWINNVRFLKNFEFNMFWHMSEGNHNSSLTRLIKDEGGTTDDWSTPGKSGDPVGVERQETIISNFIFDASYIRLREVGLYYNLPKNLITGAFKNVVQGVRIGISGHNLITITDYYGYDPEVSNFNTANAGGALVGGVDLTPFPATKRMFFHINVDL